MKKKLLATTVTVSLMSAFMTPLVVSAVGITGPQNSAFSNLPNAISTVSGWVRPAASLALLGSTIYGGFLRETAGADPEKVKKAMMVISSSIIGFTIIVLAPLIVGTISAIFGVDSIA